uniref:Uncharacterized protein n=1 Tax=Arundo donax TaxID=35708 RepID=A0A0A9CQP7_ARUDO
MIGDKLSTCCHGNQWLPHNFDKETRRTRSISTPGQSGTSGRGEDGR